MLTIHAYLKTALFKVQGKMLDFFIKELFPEIQEIAGKLAPNDESLSAQTQAFPTSYKHQEVKEGTQKQTIPTSIYNQGKTGPDLMEDVKDSLDILKKINFVEFFSHIQKGQETLVSKFKKLEENQAHIVKKITAN